jgi:hypothetical protein
MNLNIRSQGQRIEALGLTALVLHVNAHRWVLADNRNGTELLCGSTKAT